MRVLVPYLQRIIEEVWVRPIDCQHSWFQGINLDLVLKQKEINFDNFITATLVNEPMLVIYFSKYKYFWQKI
jgi:hypothetical protein